MINYDIYGQPSTWAYYGNNISDIKVACFDENSATKYNLFAGIQSGKLSYNVPLDKSISFCGIGEECPFSNLVYYHGENGSISHEKKSRITNYFLNSIPSAYGNYWDLSSAFTLYDNSNTFDLGTWEKGNVNPRNANLYIQPIADFNPKNIVLCIYVDCKSTQDGSVSTLTLEDYIDNSGYLSAPYVERVYAYPYIGNYNGTDTLRRTTPALAGNFCLTPSTLEYFESSYISKCNRYNSMNTKNDNSFPLLFSTINTNMQLENLIVFGDFTNDNNFTITQSDTKYWRTSYHVTVQNKNDFKEMCLKACAQYGLYFTPSLSVANGADNFTDENMYIGVLDSEGITHGEYLKGERTAETAQAQWDTIRDSPYDYKKNDDTNYINNTLFYSQAATGAFTKSYVLSKAQVDELAQEAYNAVAQAPAGDNIENYNQRYFLTSNVIDCIISLKKFPCKPYIPQGPVQPIKIGAYQTNIQAYPLAYSVQQFDFVFSRSNNNTLYPIYDDFRDYEPYTKCSISIPFCGNVEIPCAYAYRYDIKISLLVDLITGACTAFVICNDDVIETTSGNCAIDLPLSGLQSATLDSQMYSLSRSREKSNSSLGWGIVGGAIGIGVGIATGGIGAAVAGAAGIVASFINANNAGKTINYEMSHMQAPFKTIATASGNISQAYDMRCKMLIKRPVMGDYDNDVYGKTIGFACLKNGEVRDFTGLTQGDIRVDDVVNNSGMSPTDTEKQMIYNAFATGVIL
jgi:hypothetical protein